MNEKLIKNKKIIEALLKERDKIIKIRYDLIMCKMDLDKPKEYNPISNDILDIIDDIRDKIFKISEYDDMDKLRHDLRFINMYMN
jgi:hypothetical protein